jgi:hypothetical protein
MTLLHSGQNNMGKFVIALCTEGMLSNVTAVENITLE